MTPVPALTCLSLVRPGAVDTSWCERSPQRSHMCLAACFGFVLPQIHMLRLYLLGTGKFELQDYKSHPLHHLPMATSYSHAYIKNTLPSPLNPVSSHEGLARWSWNLSSACSDCFITLGVDRSSSSLLPALPLTSMWPCGTSAARCHGRAHSHAAPDSNLGSSSGWRRAVPFPGNHSPPTPPIQVTEPLSGLKCHDDISLPWSCTCRGDLCLPGARQPLSPLLRTVVTRREPRTLLAA